MAFVNSFDTFDGWVVPPVEWIQTANFKPLCDLSSEFTILLIELIHLLANLSELASQKVRYSASLSETNPHESTHLKVIDRRLTNEFLLLFHLEPFFVSAQS